MVNGKPVPAHPVTAGQDRSVVPASIAFSTVLVEMAASLGAWLAGCRSTGAIPIGDSCPWTAASHHLACRLKFKPGRAQQVGSAETNMGRTWVLSSADEHKQVCRSADTFNRGYGMSTDTAHE